jgi:hypothetical protein
MKMNFEEVLQGQETEDRKATQKTGNSTNTIDLQSIFLENCTCFINQMW